MFVGPRVDSDFSAFIPAMIENEAHSTWDVSGAFQLTKALAITAAVTNLTDAQYMEPLGYAALGRRAVVGIRVATSR